MSEHPDAFDLKIMQELQRDGRQTNNELATRIALSPSQCSRRRSCLEEEGYIRGYHARIDHGKLGLGLLCIISVTLSTHNQHSARRFGRFVSKLPEVLEAYALTGDMDYYLKVMTRDLRDLSRFVSDVLLPHATVQHVKTSIVLDTLKEASDYPVSVRG
ncbi:MAG: Lrp/AsnC family transcriptional regulator [Rhizomicrobium sp.]